MSTQTDYIPRPEYPRPQFVRDAWMNLNGVWEFAFDDDDKGRAHKWFDGREFEQRILVPFPYQSRLSGINDQAVHPVVWYARSFEVPQEWRGQDVLLHFGAVDYSSTVWINGKEVGHNQGGHVPFSFDIAPYLRDGVNRLAVRAVDTQDAAQPRGKQSVSSVPHDIDYYCTTGIWQTVWLEPAPALRFEELKIITHAERNQVDIVAYLHAPSAAWRVEAVVYDEDQIVARGESRVSIATGQLSLNLPFAKLWLPESPHLYALTLRLYDGETPLDEVHSYFGVRSIELRDRQVLLNGTPLYQKLVLDQGYWQESLLAAPSDEALRADIEWTKRFGFNGARKHQKIEDPRYLYWCDKLGLLVWEEMPNARKWSSIAEEKLLSEWRRAVRRDRNHPCIVAWVPVNESMGFPKLGREHHGQYAFIERMVAVTRRLDATRPVIDNDGWEHTDITDICAIHDYTPTAEGLRERYRHTTDGETLPPVIWLGKRPLFAHNSRYRGQPIILSEVGGFLSIPPDVPPEQLDMLYRFYGSIKSDHELEARYRDLMHGIRALNFVVGFCYTQLTDIEQERNGLLTYDRQPKIAPETLAAIHAELFN